MNFTKIYLTLLLVVGARDFEFTAMSDLTAKLSFLLKSATRYNIEDMEKTDIQNAYNINKERLLVPKKEDPLDIVYRYFGWKYWT